MVDENNKVKISVETKDLNTSKELAKTRTELDKTAVAGKKANEVLSAKELLGVKPYKDVQKEIKNLKTAYDTLKKSGTVSSRDLYQAQTKLQKKTAELKKETGDWVGQLGQAKAGIAALAGAGYLFIKSFSKYSEFSQRMGEVNTLIDVSQERFSALGKEIRSLTRDIPQTASQLAAAQYDILSAGVALEKSIGVLEQAAKAGVAGVTDTKTAANVGLAVINAYGKEITELNNVYDTLFQTVKLGVTTFPELAQNLGQVLPTAKAANVGINAVAASIATLTKAGIRTPQAITGLKGAINALAAPTPEARKQFEALGITWNGLIPTLEAIRKKSLDINQLRLLIPDVEARTGVLALTQNYDQLLAILNQMNEAGGATQNAYEKMKDTPENQIRLFKNEIDELMLSLGEIVSVGLLPAAKAIRIVLQSLREADPVTKGLIATLIAGGAAFAVWNLGLKGIYTGLKGAIVQIRATQAALGGLGAQATATGLAMKIGLAGAIIYTGYQLFQLGKAIKGAIDAHNTMKQAQDNLIKNSDRLINKFEEFKDVQLPDDITNLAQEDLEEFRKKLAKARAYYTALKAKLEETGADKELKVVNERLKEIQEDFKRVSKSATGAAEDMAKPAKAVEATKEALDKFEKDAKKAYDNAKKEAKSYADKVIEFEDKIKYARLSTEVKIRELRRKGLSESEQYADKRRQAEEKLYAAKQALAEKDYKLAEQLAKEAESLYTDLAEEVKEDKGGKEVVKQSLEESKEIAINGVKAVGDFIEQLYTEQKNAAQKASDEWNATAEGIKKQLEEIAKQREANVVIELKNLEAAREALRDLTKTETKIINIKYQKSGAPEQRRFGGIIGDAFSKANVIRAATGRVIPGFGGGDKVKALLEAGEGIARKEAVRMFGSKFHYAYNNMDLPGMLRALVEKKFLNFSFPDSSNRLAFADGGIVPGISRNNDVFTVSLEGGNARVPLQVVGNRNETRGALKDLERELNKLRLSRR